LSSSPKPIAELAAKANWEMTHGDKVRLFDISVPAPECGGIFDRVSGTETERAAKSIKLIKDLEEAYQNNRGHVFRAWGCFLLREDRTEEIFRLVDRFVDRACVNKQGWEVRFAQKFGVVYAAMVLGISAGILPWKRNFAYRVAKKCYRNARESASGEQRSRDVLHQLNRLIHEHGVTVSSGQKSPVKLPEGTVVLGFRKSGRRKYGVLDTALGDLLGTKNASAFTKVLASKGLLDEGHGHAGTRQERFPISKDGVVIKKPRMWGIDGRRLKQHLGHQ
jgi:hypothetical protein